MTAVSGAVVLVVDDDDTLRDVLAEAVTALGHSAVTAESAEAASGLLEHGLRPDLVLTDVNMPGASGVELCARIKNDARFLLTPVILLTAVYDLDSRVAGLAAGADDFFAKPFQLVELGTRVTALLQAKRALDELERAEDVITSLGRTIEARDPYTAGHCERLSGYAVAVGTALGVDARTVKALRLGGYLHDLGKIAIPDTVLLKGGPLDAAERAVIQVHPAVGAELVRGLRSLDGAIAVIRHHHERMNGAGYPDGLKGDAIPIGARILAVVDVFDALHTPRPYKPAFSMEQSLGLLRRETDAGAWDPRVVEALIPIVRETPAMTSA